MKAAIDLDQDTERTQDLVLQHLELWREGFLTSFDNHNIVNYDGEIREFWNRQFSTLTQNAHVVDLATGNGPVALLAAQFSAAHKMQFRISALDKAPIDPQKDIPEQYHHVRRWLRDIQFQGNAPSESTGLDSQCADLVTSSYGFEYGDQAASAIEAARILKPGGHIALIAHHASSVMVNEARENLEQLRLFDKERILVCARKLVDSMGICSLLMGKRFAKPNSKTETLKNELDNAILRVMNQAERLTNSHGISYMRLGLESALKPGITRAKRRKIIRELQEGCDSDRRSIASYLSVALDSRGFAQLVSQLQAAGLKVCESFPLVVSKPAFQRDQRQLLKLEEQLPSRFVYFFRPMRPREVRVYQSLIAANAPLPGESSDALMGWALVARKG